MQLSPPGVPIPALSQLLFFLSVGSRKKVTCLLAHIQLFLTDGYTRVKELFASHSFLMKDAVLIVIASLLLNICMLLKNLRLHTSFTARVMNCMFCVHKTDKLSDYMQKRGSWLIIG